MLYFSTMWYYVVLCGTMTMWYYVVLRGTVWYYLLLCGTMWYYFSTMWYYEGPSIESHKHWDGYFKKLRRPGHRPIGRPRVPNGNDTRGG